MYRQLFYDYDKDHMVPSKKCLDERYRNLRTFEKTTTVLGEKEAYTVVAYYTLDGRLPPTEGDIGVMVLKHIKALEG